VTTYDNADLEPRDAGMEHLLAGLEQAYATRMPEAPRAAIGHDLAIAARTRRAPASRRRAFPALGRTRSRLISLAVVAVVTLSGLFGYMRLDSATPASAAQILRHAAGALATTGTAQVVHEIIVEQETVPHDANSLTHEQWTQLNSEGQPVAVDEYAVVGGSTTGRMVADAQGHLWSDGGSGSIFETAWTPGKPLFSGPPPSDPMAILFLAKQTANTPQDPAAMQSILLAAAGGKDGDVRLLPQQVIDGHTVDVVEVSRSSAGQNWRPAPNATRELVDIYIDASSYLIRRIDMRGVDEQGTTVSDETMSITLYQVLSPSEVPPGTFTFTPPPGASVLNCTATPHPSECGPSHPQG